MTSRYDAPTNDEDLVRSFFPGTGRSYDRVVKIFTLGLDNYWKREIVRLVPPSDRILELACGTGILTEHLARKQPSSEIVGVDITPDYLAMWEERMKRRPWMRARAVRGNAENVGLEGEFDAIVSSYLAKYVDLDKLLGNVTPHLRKGGMFIAHDFTLPTNPAYLAIWRAYTQAMNRIGPRALSGWDAVFDDGLTGLIRRTNWLDDIVDALRRNGYRDIHIRHLSFETAGLAWAVKA